MDQTPVHEQHNPDLLAYLPKDAKDIVEVGCSSGALAREYKKVNPTCHYTGLEISQQYAELAKRYCDSVVVLDIEQADANFFGDRAACDCWVFGDSLEHLKDPWRVLSNIRKVIPVGGSIVACVPNAQHWSLQMRLCAGEFRYESAGLLDKTHLRWFTRTTLIEMFNSTGFKVVEGKPRIFLEPQRELALPAIKFMAQTCGVDVDQAVKDSLPLQYVIRATPV